jgi:hypothetical protein
MLNREKKQINKGVTTIITGHEWTGLSWDATE